jgi:undecaprenyl-diphosphatase
MPFFDRKTADRVFIAGTVLLTAVEALLILYSPLQLAPDEAHYWDWSRRLAASYYSKGPLIAYLIAFSRGLFGETEFAVRFPALVCGTMFSIALYLFIRRFYSARLALSAWLAARAMLLFAQMGIVMTTDAPAALCWLLAIICASLALIEERRWFWTGFGLWIGIGILAKYTVFFLFPSVVLLLILTTSMRSHLKSLHLYAGAFVLLLCLLPILFWNAQHGWVNFAHNAGHVVKGTGIHISGRYLPELLLGQAALVGPIIFAGLLWALVRGYAVWRRGDASAGLFFFSSAPLGVFVLLLSLTKRIYANWPLPLYIGALLLFVHLLSLRLLGGGRTQKWIRAGIILSAVLTVLAHFPFAGLTFGLPGGILPTKKLAGWRTFGERVEALLQQSAVSDGEADFFLTDEYETASEAAFYAASHPQVYCANVDSRRMNQYDVWGGLDRMQGKNALIVLKSPERIEALRSHFGKIEEVKGESVMSVEYSGATVRTFYFYRGISYDGSVPPIPQSR